MRHNTKPNRSSTASAAQQLIELSEKLSKGDVAEAVKMFQWGLYAFKVQENPDIPPPYLWH